MNTQKYKMGNSGLLREADRSMYDKSDTVSKSLIDRARTESNYNLCPHEQYTPSEIKAINEKIRGKNLAKNAIAWGGTVVTQPQDYEGSTEDFFKTAYEGLKKMYKLNDEDIISAYVHLDETTPHMHFYFIPIKHDREKPDCINWDKVMPRKMYQTQHRVLQKYMTEQLQTPVNLLNGKTKGIDMQKLSPEEKRLSMRVADLQKSVGALRKRKIAVSNDLDAIYKPYIEAQERLIKQFASLKPKEREREKSEIEKLLEQSNRVFGDLNGMRKATAALEKVSDRLQADYLTIEDDDDFER